MRVSKLEEFDVVPIESYGSTLSGLVALPVDAITYVVDGADYRGLNTVVLYGDIRNCKGENILPIKVFGKLSDVMEKINRGRA